MGSSPPSPVLQAIIPAHRRTFHPIPHLSRTITHSIRMSAADSGHSSRFEFCPDCGAVLDLTTTDLVSNTIKCLRCTSSHDIALFLGLLSISRIVFNDKEQIRKAYVSAKKKNKKHAGEEEASGPVVEMECPKCKYNRMSYKTLQLRSADEGQTVFFSCLKCGAQFSENS